MRRAGRRSAAPAALALLLAVAAVGAAGPGPAGAAPAEAPAGPSAEPGTWGLGWVSGGVTLRLAPGGGWEIDLAGGPRDRKVDGSRDVSRYDSGALVEYREPDHETRESGWVRLMFARRLARHERLSLALTAGASHGWADGQTRDYYYDTWDEQYSTTVHDTFTGEWNAIVALRPRYRLLERLTAEFQLGFAYRWLDETDDRQSDDPGRQAWEHQRVSDQTRTFSTWGGWSGLGSLSLVFWF